MGLFCLLQFKYIEGSLWIFHGLRDKLWCGCKTRHTYIPTRKIPLQQQWRNRAPNLSVLTDGRCRNTKYSQCFRNRLCTNIGFQFPIRFLNEAEITCLSALRFSSLALIKHTWLIYRWIWLGSCILLGTKNNESWLECTCCYSQHCCLVSAAAVS